MLPSQKLFLPIIPPTDLFKIHSRLYMSVCWWWWWWWCWWFCFTQAHTQNESFHNSWEKPPLGLFVSTLPALKFTEPSHVFFSGAFVSKFLVLHLWPRGRVSHNVWNLLFVLNAHWFQNISKKWSIQKSIDIEIRMIRFQDNDNGLTNNHNHSLDQQ